jgi:hypothetical protein
MAIKRIITGLLFASACLVNAEESYLVNPEWSFKDSFDGTRDSSFWLADGVYVDYGVASPYSDSQVMVMRYVPNSEGGGDSWSEYDFRLGVDAVQLEMGWRMFIPENYKHIERNHKVFALWSGTYGKSKANISVSSEAWGMTGGASPSVYVGVDGNNYGHSMNTRKPLIWSDSLGDGRWIDLKIVLDLADSVDGHGRMDIFLDGVLITGTHDPDLSKSYSSAPIGVDLIKFSENGNFIDQGTILGWANGDLGFLDTTEFLLDDFYVNANSAPGKIVWSEGSKAAMHPGGFKASVQ